MAMKKLKITKKFAKQISGVLGNAKHFRHFQACKVFHTLHTMIKNKKGIFFTFIAIILIMILMLTFKPRLELSIDKDIPVVKTRVTKIDGFITDFENVYLPNIVRGTTYKALTALTYYIDEEDEFLEDLQSDFKEVLLDGTINSVLIDQITGEKLMTNNTLKNWTDKIKTSAKDVLNIDLEYTIEDVNVYQTTPWFIDINLTIDYSVYSETASWTRNNVLIKTRVSIDNLYDPLYYVNTNGNYKKKITQTDIKFGEWNTNTLSLFIQEEEYAHWQNSNAPNFLMRFTNAFSPSECCGIESAVNPNKITPSDQLEIYLDYLFFDPASTPECTELYYITGLPPEFSDFKLDFSNAVKYNLEEDAQVVCTE